MLLSLALIFLVGLSMAEIMHAIRLPRIIGMLLSGVVMGPFVLDLIDTSVLDISSELRKIALIIILIKAGISLNLSDLKKVGRPAVLMCFMPACFEILGYIVFAPLLLGVSYIESALLGAVLSAVSPAVVVPRMIKLIEEKYGTKKSIPQMILTGASCDDIFVIVLFSAFVSANQGNSIDIVTFANIPISIMLGIFLGIIFGFGIYFVFETAFRKNYKIRGSVKIIILLAVSFLLVSIEETLKNHIAVSGLLAVTAMACVIKLKIDKKVSGRLSEKFGKLWICAEILLFVLVGASVDIRYTFDAGIAAVGMIFIALVFRAVGVWGCLLGTNLSIKERFFCVIAYLPKATVQAAIGSIPLSLGLACGKIVLSVAVLAIIITAPLGSLGIDNSYKKLLQNDKT